MVDITLNAPSNILLDSPGAEEDLFLRKSLSYYHQPLPPSAARPSEEPAANGFLDREVFECLEPKIGSRIGLASSKYVEKLVELKDYCARETRNMGANDLGETLDQLLDAEIALQQDIRKQKMLLIRC